MLSGYLGTFALPLAVGSAIAGAFLAVTPAAGASPQQCAPRGTYSIDITRGDLTCDGAYAIANRYNLMGEKFQVIDSFKCAYGNAMTRPVIFTCVSNSAEFAVSEV